MQRFFSVFIIGAFAISSYAQTNDKLEGVGSGEADDAYQRLIERVKLERGYKENTQVSSSTTQGSSFETTSSDELKSENVSLDRSRVVEAETQQEELKGTEDYQKFRLGGYGELYGRHMDYGWNRYTGASYGNMREDRYAIAMPRFVVAGDYRFNRWWNLGAEIEFESGGTGVAWEQESGTGGENGEIEVEYEKGGEVALEQFHITATIHPSFNVRMGHVVVPVGLLNEHHEPINFFGTQRPEGECAIVPTTWHETGVELYGSVGKGWYDFDYQAQMVSGLTVDGLDKYNFLSGAKQGLFEEDVFTCPAFVGRVNYNGVPGLRVGGSIYYLDDAGENSRKPYKYSKFKTSVLVYSVDAEYKNKYVTARGNYLQGTISNYDKLNSANVGTTSHSTDGDMYSGRTPIASKGLTYGGEVGLNVGQVISDVFALNKSLKIVPFARYEYYNPFYDGTANGLAELSGRQEVSMWTVGVNWFALPTLVLKADWTMRHIGTQNVFKNNSGYNSENDVAIGIAYVGWWAKK